jgi:cell division protein FtsL
VKQRPFLALWTLAVAATVAAFVLHLALRGRTVDLGYRLGRARAEEARLREVKRVLSLEAASYETPQRVEMVARTLLGMTPPPAERVISLRGVMPSPDANEPGNEAQDGVPPAPPQPASSGDPAVAAAAPPAPAADAPHEQGSPGAP